MMAKCHYRDVYMATSACTKDLTWLAQVKEAHQDDWLERIPSFFYCILCGNPQFCEKIGIDEAVCHTISVGRYVYLSRSLARLGTFEAPPWIAPGKSRFA